MADRGLMEQVLFKLAINARDAMARGGELTIGTDVVTIGKGPAAQDLESRSGQFVCLLVRDTGCGIAAKKLPSISEPFFTTKDVGKGVGLGLATVHGIVSNVELVEVKNYVGEVSRFRYSYPLVGAGALNFQIKRPGDIAENRAGERFLEILIAKQVPSC